MNDIQITQVNSLTNTVQSSGSERSQSDSEPRAVEIPTSTAGTVEASVEVNTSVTEAVAQMNDFIQAEQRDLQFSVDEELGTTIVKVMDRETGDLIRQIPEETFIELARSAREQEQFQLINVQG